MPEAEEKTQNWLVRFCGIWDACQTLWRWHVGNGVFEGEVYVMEATSGLPSTDAPFGPNAKPQREPGHRQMVYGKGNRDTGEGQHSHAVGDRVFPGTRRQAGVAAKAREP